MSNDVQNDVQSDSEAWITGVSEELFHMDKYKGSISYEMIGLCRLLNRMHKRGEQYIPQAMRPALLRHVLATVVHFGGYGVLDHLDLRPLVLFLSGNNPSLVTATVKELETAKATAMKAQAA
jgi:hypothetical protein